MVHQDTFTLSETRKLKPNCLTMHTANSKLNTYCWLLAMSITGGIDEGGTSDTFTVSKTGNLSNNIAW